MKGNKSVNLLSPCRFSEITCEDEKEKVQFLHKFSAIKKRPNFRFLRFESKVVPIDSGHLFKKCVKRKFL